MGAILLVLGLVLYGLAYLWMLGVAFGINPVFGLGVLVIGWPFYIVLVVANWKLAKSPLVFAILGLTLFATGVSLNAAEAGLSR